MRSEVDRIVEGQEPSRGAGTHNSDGSKKYLRSED
jgi:hypothetical protein